MLQIPRMNHCCPEEQLEDELMSIKGCDTALRIIADVEGSLIKDVQNVPAEEIICVINDTGIINNWTSNSTETQRNQSLPEIVNTCTDGDATWEDKSKTTAVKLQEEIKKPLLNQAVQAMFYRAVGFSKPRKGIDASQCKLENARSRNSICHLKARGDVSPRPNKPKKVDDYKNFRPIFYVSGTNGTDLVISFCENRGWKRIYDNDRADYLLKWCEINTPNNFQCFQEGKQLLNQIPNDKLLTTKVGLCSSLKTYDQLATKRTKVIYPRVLKMEEFYPETYRMDVKSERLAFFQIMEDVPIWISKPAGSNLGKGIFLLKCQEDFLDFRAKLESIEKNTSSKMYCYGLPSNRIVQRYLHKPLLLEGRKFDVRSYFLIASTSPHMIFFRHGYVKLACNQYDPYSDDLTSHLTNQFVQKKNPLYSEMKEDTVWSMEHLNDYINKHYMEEMDLPKDWVFTVFEKRMQKIMIQCFFAVKGKLECKLGYFNLLGCDFIVDQNFKIWLLEMNANPSLQRHCEVLKTVIPKLVYEALDVVLEIFKKCSKGLHVLPLQSQKEFVLIYNGDHQEKLTRSLPRTESNVSPTILKQPCRVAVGSVKCTEKSPMQKSMTSSNPAVASAKILQNKLSFVPYAKLPAISLTVKQNTSKTNFPANFQLAAASPGENSQLKSDRHVSAFKKIPMTTQLKPLVTRNPHSSSHPRQSLVSNSLLVSGTFHPKYINTMVAKSSEMKMSSKENKTPSGDAA
ncbi:protein polyglycylase TTLL10-like isoform X1 [Chiloscyllium plagiosum]|uniref:protein polyglycylase TTLL10-like isoform X1 n=1 Tax=Chiloscyllium plagiosum TaxID=36176 RepID=UPI001CB7ECD0|nr:protein polyglycylase TTLL10-like isoform X1 [Chiloscyllium plagiosum]